MRRILIFFVSLVASITALAQSSQTQTIEQFLHAFHKNPQKMMRELPPLVDSHGVAHLRGDISDQMTQQQLDDRYKVRSEIIANSLPVFTPFELQDKQNNAAVIIEPGPIVTNIRDLENQHLTQSSLPTPPWDDSYWPIYKGLTATRYADPRFPNADNWPANFGYSQAHPASEIWASGDQTAIDNLSPAEKYDIAIGDMNFTLTNYAWKVGQDRYNKSGTVPHWTGICHGWSGASQMNALYPRQPVVVTTANGATLRFYTEDVKALQSMLWANAPPATRFIGSRCDIYHPPHDGSGHITDPACFDTNPATWHLIITNQLGIHQRSFVMDGTYDAEVWNFPVASYTYTYFNPQTMRGVRNASQATVDMQHFTLDKFRQYRDPSVRYVVGIVMDVTYVTEINPTHALPTPNPLMKTARYMYDLELDDGMNIIGGEWYILAHPDFVWTFNQGAQALALGDSTLMKDPWTIALPVPGSWGTVAQRASSRGTPLFSFIRQLTTPLADPGSTAGSGDGSGAGDGSGSGVH